MANQVPPTFLKPTPQEVVKKKIAEMEKRGEPVKPTAPPSSPSLMPSKKPSGGGKILSIISIVFVVILFLATAVVYLNLRGISSRVGKIEKSLGALATDAGKAEIESLKTELSDFKNKTDERLKPLEEKIAKITPANYATKEDIKVFTKILKTIDTDRDGLTDYEEVVIYGSNPNLKDTDKDGYTDKQEVDAGYNPAGKGKLKKKTTSEKQEMISVKAFKYGYDPNTIEVEAGTKVKIELVSLDSEHTFTIDDLGIDQKVKGGGTEIIEFTPEKKGDYTFYSTIAEDRAKGMVGKLTVK